MKHVLPLAFAAALSGCTTPDVSVTLTQTRAEFIALSENLDRQIIRDAAGERAREQDRAIVSGGSVIGFVGDCDTLAAQQEITVISDCVLVEYFDPRDDPGSATELKDFLTVIDGYLLSLERLAASQTADQAKQQTDEIVAAFGMPDEARPAAFERLGASLRTRQTSIGTSTRFFVNQARVRALRRAMADANALLEESSPIIVAHLSLYDSARVSAQAHFLTARQSMLDAESQGNPAALRSAVQEAREAFAAFKAAEANSPVVQFLQFRQTHARLLAMTQPGADASEFVEYFEELRALYDNINEDT